LTNDGWLREGSKVVVIIVTDTDDSSNPKQASDAKPGGLFEAWDSADITPYLRAFEQFDKDITFAVIGPNFTDCNSDGSVCDQACIEPQEAPSDIGVSRMISLAMATGGFYRPIAEGDGEEIGDDNCDVADFSKHLDKLGELMINLQTAFTLRAVPDEESIRVYVDDSEVSKASKTSSDSDDELTFGAAYDDGWSYDPGQNAVLFWGDAIPDFNQDVEIFYRPIGGNPRSLPF
tara:strand:+ start:176 stop:874 length:699 start_codon:yes stop_codon:yes gene_type:complete